jgi:DNA-directed RNA polymerase subunit RPC12/RpoP
MAKMQEFKCPCCGGSIEFDSSVQKMKCPFCDTEFDVGTLSEYAQTVEEEQPEDMSWSDEAGSEWQDGESEGLRTYVCKSCGGEIVADENTAASTCPFCGNPIVMTGKLSGELRPDILIPFKLDKKAAKAGLMKHLEGKKLLPKIFKDQNHIDEIRGIYVPFWLFNTEADANIRYRGTRTRFWSDSKYNYTETSYFLINRGGTIGFEKVPVDGDSKIPDDLMESIEPYDLKEAVPFQAAYLAGYLADRYDVDSEKSAPRANERVKKSVERAFEETVTGYATVMTENSSVQLRDGSAQYALLPVWILNTTWEGKHYLFAMNGQTGKFVGDLPADKNAARKMTIKLTVIITIVVYILRLILWMFGI